MRTTTLRKVGGSVMLAVPPAFLDLLHLRAGAMVGIGVEGNRLVVEANPRPRYRLDDLLDQCGTAGQRNAEDREWLDAKPVGDELL